MTTVVAAALFDVADTTELEVAVLEERGGVKLDGILSVLDVLGTTRCPEGFSTTYISKRPCM